MAKREFLMLCQNFNIEKHYIGYWFLSEKLDGMRAFWDGGITRGKLCSEVGFANTEKDSRYREPPRATGLWTRYGKAIQAPSWWLDKLPYGIPLDGELYMGRGRFQELMSTVKQMISDARWNGVEFRVFDTPPYHVIFGDGMINNTMFKKRFQGVERGLLIPETRRLIGAQPYNKVYSWLVKEFGGGGSVVVVHEQIQLSSSVDARKQLMDYLEEVTNNGGEGVILRNPSSLWVPERNYGILKAKKLQDAEAMVIGYTWGRETELGSKLLGLMGALIVNWGGHTFELSGFTDEERRMAPDGASEIGIMNPGKVVDTSIGIYNQSFPIGSKVTFRYRELSDAGIPKEARYWRK